MGGDIRVLCLAPDDHSAGIAAHVRGLQAAGHTVLYVTADRPYQSLMDTFETNGVDAQSVFFIDAVTCMDGHAAPSRLPNALFLQSPTMLEMIAMRVEQMLGRVGPSPVVVIDSLSTLSLYNDVPPVQEFSHYIANRLRTHGVSGHLVLRDNAAGRAIHDRVRDFTDGEIRLEGAS